MLYYKEVQIVKDQRIFLWKILLVTRFDVSKMNIKPCLGCVTCGYEGPCVQKDDNEVIKKALLSSDMLVLATPLYY